MMDTKQQVITNEQLLTLFSEELRRKARSKHTVRAYLADVRKLLQFLQLSTPEYHLVETTSEAIDSYVEHLEKATPSDSSIKRQVMGLRQFFSFLVRQKTMQTNPIRGVSVVHVPADAIPYGNLKRMLEHIVTRQSSGRPEDQVRYMRDELAMLLMLILGVRQYQIPMLRISSMQKENGSYFLTVSPGFIVKIDGVILTLLHNYLLTRQVSEDAIFVEPGTKRVMTPSSFRAVMSELTYAAGSTVNPKTIRHTYELFQSNPDSMDAMLQWIAGLHNGRAID